MPFGLVNAPTIFQRAMDLMVKESKTSITIEKEHVNEIKYAFAHNRHHNYYFVNKYYLEESLN